MDDMGHDPVLPVLDQKLELGIVLQRLSTL
jgi:hypothetical protein